MARLDWTARCEEGRRDELGLLAHNLNLMAERLDAAMQALEADVDEIAALSAQQREFFAAASHELKTPLTILRGQGQLESMQLGLGRYRDPQAVLPEALAEVARMERLEAEILTLVKLERADAWTQTPLDLSALTVEVCTALAPLDSTQTALVIVLALALIVLAVALAALPVLRMQPRAIIARLS